MKNTPFTPKNPNVSSDFSWFTEASAAEKLKMVFDYTLFVKQVIESLMQEEVEQKAGPRYARSSTYDYYRWSSNPSSIRVGAEKISIDVPRTQHKQTQKVEPVSVFQDFKELEQPTEEVFKQLLHGITTRDYEQVFKTIDESSGLSKSTISRQFIAACKVVLDEFENRDWSSHNFVALYLDGKSFEKEQMIVVLGITDAGHKKVLGFTQSAYEAKVPVQDLLENLIGRGLKFEEALLGIIDGSKGLRAGLKAVFGDKVFIQRCRIHKVRNILAYLPKEDHSWLRRQMQKIYVEDSYTEAIAKAGILHDILAQKNKGAAQSLLEGLEESLTLQQLGVNALFSKCFGSTNCIESLNAQLQKYTARVKRWVNSEQRYRWVSASLLSAETRLRRVDNHVYLDKLKTALSTHYQSIQKDNPLIN